MAYDVTIENEQTHNIITDKPVQMNTKDEQWNRNKRWNWD